VARRYCHSGPRSRLSIAKPRERDPKAGIHHRPGLASTLVSGTHGERMPKELPPEAERAEFDRWLESTAEAKPRDEKLSRAERELSEAWDLVISGVEHSDTRCIVHLADQLRAWRAKLPVGEEARKFQENLEARCEASKREPGLHFPKSLPPQLCSGVYTPLQWTPHGYQKSPERPTPIGDTLLPAWPECGSVVALEWVLEAVQKSEAARELAVKSVEVRREKAASREAVIVKKAKALLLAGRAHRGIAGTIAGPLGVTSRHVRGVLEKYGILIPKKSGSERPFSSVSPVRLAPVTQLTGGFPMQRKCYSLATFCVEHDLNHYTFKALKKAGLAPRTFKIGSKEFVTEESAAEWRRMMDGKPALQTEEVAHA
jgi:hypothetical protein